MACRWRASLGRRMLLMMIALLWCYVVMMIDSSFMHEFSFFHIFFLSERPRSVGNNVGNNVGNT
jgi:hypothetical protein